MPHARLEQRLLADLGTLADQGRRKGAETVVTGVIAAAGGRGPRYTVAEEGGRAYLRMNSNNYLGLSALPAVIAAEEQAVRAFGAGPGAVRFISGTTQPHVELERRLAAFHGREAAMLFSSAYMTVLGVLTVLITAEAAVISDELNHNSIINAIRLSRPLQRAVYKHLDFADLERCLDAAKGACRRAVVVTDGVFSMRGDCADLAQLMNIAGRHDGGFPENVVVVVDDSHGVGAFGPTGRGTEEHAGSPPVDVLIGTLGKAFGVNGGYVVGNRTLIDYLRETAATYIYSNPITPGEAAAALRVLDVVVGEEGRRRLAHLKAMTDRFSAGLRRLGLETIVGGHPIVPLLLRDTARTAAAVAFLRRHGVLATGLKFPVVPRGEEEIRFQVCADHTADDVDEVLGVLARFVAAPDG